MPAGATTTNQESSVKPGTVELHGGDAGQCGNLAVAHHAQRDELAFANMRKRGGDVVAGELDLTAEEIGVAWLAPL